MAQDTDDIDRLTVALIDELKEHREEYLRLHPGTDPRLIFEGWVIQKLAGIHYILGDRPKGKGE